MSSLNKITRAAVAVSSLALVACSSLLGGCGLFDGTTEAVVAVDSVSVVASTGTNSTTQLTFFGVVGFNSCWDLSRVDRAMRGSDTVQWRFIARREGQTCLASPTMLRFKDSIPSLPARTMTLRVEQPSGAPLVKTVQLPLSAAP